MPGIPGNSVVMSGPSRAPGLQAPRVDWLLYKYRQDSTMRRLIIGFALCSIGGIILPAAADNGALYVAPGPSSLVAPDVVRRSQEQLAGTARKLGDLLAIRSNHPPAMRRICWSRPSADTISRRAFPTRTGPPKLSTWATLRRVKAIWTRRRRPFRYCASSINPAAITDARFATIAG